jgi:hypothetical protein
MVTAGKEPVESKAVHVAAAYAILMNGRNDKLSTWHRLTTFIAIKGQLDDSVSIVLLMLYLICTCLMLSLKEDLFAVDQMRKTLLP